VRGAFAFALILLAGCLQPSDPGTTQTSEMQSGPHTAQDRIAGRACGPGESPTTGFDTCCPPDTHPTSMGCLGWPPRMNLTIEAAGALDILIPLPVEPWCLSPRVWLGTDDDTQWNGTHMRIVSDGSWHSEPIVRDLAECRPVGMGAVHWPANATVVVKAGAGSAKARLSFTADYYWCDQDFLIDLAARGPQRPEVPDLGCRAI
jgi:hypothetical protein